MEEIFLTEKVEVHLLLLFFLLDRGRGGGSVGGSTTSSSRRGGTLDKIKILMELKFDDFDVNFVISMRFAAF